MKKIGIGVTLLAALGMMGCIANYDYNNVDNDRFSRISDFTGGFAGNVELAGGSLVGQIGQVDVDNDSPELSGFDDGGFAYVEVMGEGDNGVAMNIVELNGGTSHPALRDGLSQTFTYDEYFEADDSQLRVMSLGCSGDAAYAWDFDQPATETELNVVEVEEGLRVDYTTRTERVDGMTGIETGDMQVSSGSFIIVQ